MTTKKHSLFVVFAGLWMSACSGSGSASSQLLIKVQADSQLSARLARVTVNVLPADATQRTSDTRAHDFKIAHDDPKDGAVKLPFSFGIERRDAQKILVVVEGYEHDEVVVEHKLIATFEDGLTRELTVKLADACADHVCAELQATCAPEAHSCVDVDSGDPLDAGQPLADTSAEKKDQPTAGKAAMQHSDAVTMPTAGKGAQPSKKADAGVQKKDEPSDDADGGKPEPTVCDRNNSCTNPAYPCVPGKNSGYTCQGQFADWPMPDTLATSKNKPSYDITSIPDVVIDRVTQLEWQRLIPQTYPGCSGNVDRPSDTCTWEEAKSYCKALTLAGGGWRLPSKVELESLLGDPSNAPTADFQAFPDLSGSNVFWTVSPLTDNKGNAWTVRSGLGMTLPEDEIMTRNVRCVRAGLIADGTPAEHYQLNVKDDSITDTHTKLEWQRVYGDNDTIESARSYCEKLGSGWRLPGLNELLTLVDPTGYEPAIDPVFPALPLGGMFWTNTPMLKAIANEPQFMVVEFSAGMTGGEKMFRQVMDSVRFTFHARCVR